MDEPVLVIENLQRRFGALRVTDDVSLTVRPQTIHAIIGPNGAGKTTLINQVFGILRPDSGIVRLDGRDVTRLAPHRRARLGLARSFQITSVLPEFTALDNVALAVQARSGGSFRFFRPAVSDDAINDAAQAMLDSVGLGKRRSILAGSLSHGEKRQLELAMALATKPRVMLLDEPLAGAGPEETARLVTLLGGLRATCAVVLVEHDMDTVFQLADEITVLALGRVIAHGTPAEIRADPAVRTAYLGEDF